MDTKTGVSSGTPLPYRRCVGIMLVNRFGRVWVGERVGGIEHRHGDARWQMPQGGIEKGEAPEAAAIRELYEETSVTSMTIKAETAGWLDYDIPGRLVGNTLKGRYRGQTQKWFLAEFTGDETEIDVETPGGGHRAEFSAWKWVDVDELPDLIVPFKRPVYEALVKEFGPLAKAISV